MLRRPMVLTLVVLGAWAGFGGCDDGGGDGDGDGDVDSDVDVDADSDTDSDSDVDHIPVGQDCTDDTESCPDRYQCHCFNPAPGIRRCACGIECENDSDCTDEGQPICCWSTCTDPTTCYTF